MSSWSAGEGTLTFPEPISQPLMTFILLEIDYMKAFRNGFSCSFVCQSSEQTHMPEYRNNHIDFLDELQWG